LSRNYVLGLDLGTTLGVSRVSLDGGLDAQALRFEGNIGSRTVGVHGAVRRFAGPDCLGVSIEEPFSGQFSSVEALFPMLGAAVLACELAGLRWSAVHFSKLKLHAIGKGNAKKPDMQAAAKARWGKDLGEDEATRLGLALSRWTLIYSVSSQQKPQPQGKG
jgi:Holliday junction resolvasome RuvABC endonuclease subunit